MPGLHTLLSGYEPDMIHVIAQRWGVDFIDKPIEQLREDVVLALNDPVAIYETIQALPKITRQGQHCQAFATKITSFLA